MEEARKRARPGRTPSPAGPTSRPCQAEVARLAGVSQATVSLVLGARKQSVAVSEETERHAPADELLRLVADGFPVVHLGRRDELEGLAWVGADYISASRTVVARLAALGIGWA